MSQLEKLELATSRYHATALIEASGFAPLGTTVGAAKWLSYELAGSVGMIAPYGTYDAYDGAGPVSLRKLDDERFETAYRERLDRFGTDSIARVLIAFAQAHHKQGGAFGCVLLCFENVLEGETCHRRLFASWWEEKTGYAVPELAPQQGEFTHIIGGPDEIELLRVGA